MLLKQQTRLDGDFILIKSPRRLVLWCFQHLAVGNAFCALRKSGVGEGGDFTSLHLVCLL